MLSSGHGVSQDPAGPQDPREDSHRQDGAETREIFTESCKPPSRGTDPRPRGPTDVLRGPLAPERNPVPPAWQMESLPHP